MVHDDDKTVLKFAGRLGHTIVVTDSLGGPFKRRTSCETCRMDSALKHAEETKKYDPRVYERTLCGNPKTVEEKWRLVYPAQTTEGLNARKGNTMSKSKKSTSNGKKKSAKQDRVVHRAPAEPKQETHTEEPSGEAPGTDDKPKREKKVKEPKAPKEPSLIDHAVNILKRAGTEMHCPAITDAALKEGWTTNGKTPAATLHAAISREIKIKGAESRFVKGTARGTFALA